MVALPAKQALVPIPAESDDAVNLVVSALPPLPPVIRYYDEFADIHRSIPRPHETKIFEVWINGTKQRLDFTRFSSDDALLLLRTNDLLRSYTDPDYRREKLRYLNHNERTHQLQRQIRHAGSGSTRGRRQEELAAQSHCLALCTNLVMAYNTSALQRTLDGWRKGSGHEIEPSIQRFISPMGFEHINFDGVIVFPFQHYRAQLLAPRRGFRAQSSRH